MFTGSKLSTGIVLICSVSAYAQTNHDLLKDYNLIVSGNRFGNSEVEGRVLIGGNASGSFSNVGFNGGNLGNASSVDSLIVDGNLSANANIQSGRLRVLGAISGNINNNTGNSSSIFFDTTTAVPTSAQIATELQSRSTEYASLKTTGTVTLPANVPNQDLVLTGHPDSTGLTVFNIDGSLLNDRSVNQIYLNANGATNVVINVTGTNVTVGHTMGGDFSRMDSKVIFNFVDATSLTTTNEFFGSILAPNANFGNQGGDVDGGVFVNTFTQSNEIHVPYFTGYEVSTPLTPNAVAAPEPSTIFSALLGVLGLITYYRSKQAKVV